MIKAFSEKREIADFYNLIKCKAKRNEKDKNGRREGKNR